MTGNFRTVKKKFIIIAAVVGAVAGICLGLLATGAVLLALKLSGIELHWAIYVAIGVGVALLSGAAAFFIALPSDKRIAKKLDRDFALGEKVQTMVAYSAAENPDEMVLLQREQADEALGAVAKKRIKLGGLWKFVFIPVLAAAMFVAGMVVPLDKQVDVGPQDPPYDITETQRTALLSLIADVEGSELTETVKTPVLAVLNDLLGKLETTETQTEMKAEVISAVKAIDGHVSMINNYLGVYSAIAAEETLKTLADAVVDGAAFYKASGTDIQAMETVTQFYKNAPQEIFDCITVWADEVKALYGEATTISETGRIIRNYANTLYAKLITDNTAAPDMGDSALYDALRTFISDMIKLSSSSQDGVGVAIFRAEVDKAVDKAVSAVTSDLCVQSYNCMMDDYVRNSLAKIFGLTRGEIGSNESVVPDFGGDDDDGPTHSGGFGPGDVEFGSDDLVLHPDTLEKVPYGQLINQYNAAIQERINAGDTPEELAKYIRSYFDKLYGGLGEDE